VERVRADAAPAALPAESLDEEQTERLRSLGYAGRIPHVAERLPMAEELSVAGLDPKWIVDVAMAGRDLEVGLLDEARRKLQRFLETAPDPEARPEVRPLWSSAHGNLALLALQFEHEEHLRPPAVGRRHAAVGGGHRPRAPPRTRGAGRSTRRRRSDTPAAGPIARFGRDPYVDSPLIGAGITRARGERRLP
jgi:hypothetical protein